jgi:hypothetical protein
MEAAMTARIDPRWMEDFDRRWNFVDRRLRKLTQGFSDDQWHTLCGLSGCIWFGEHKLSYSVFNRLLGNIGLIAVHS